VGTKTRKRTHRPSSLESDPPRKLTKLELLPPPNSELGYVIIVRLAMSGPITSWVPRGGEIVISARVDITRRAVMHIGEPIGIYGSDGRLVYTSTGYPSEVHMDHGDVLELTLNLNTHA